MLAVAIRAVSPDQLQAFVSWTHVCYLTTQFLHLNRREDNCEWWGGKGLAVGSYELFAVAISLTWLTRRCVVLSESPRNGRMFHSVVGSHMVKTRKDSCLCDYCSLLFAELFLSLCEHLSFIYLFFSEHQRFEFPC